MELYLDNYKGFVDTLIPIKDVTFLVGENSTGKTSILKLLEVISQPNFWLNPSFNNQDIELGYFSEIVCQLPGRSKDYFSFGLYFDEEKGDCPYECFIWMKFKEDESTPVLAEFKFIVNNTCVWCNSIKQKAISYRTKPLEEGTKFSQWIRDFNDYIDVENTKIEYGSFAPFAILRAEIENEINHIDESEGRGCKIPRPFNRFQWIAPIRAKAKRWYESYRLSYSSEGDHMPVLLKKILSKKETKRGKSFMDTLELFGKNSGLFDSIEVKEGASSDSPFALIVKYGKLSVNIANVGYGISQVLPLIVELQTSSNDSFAIQQPEVHLHPKAQAAFGEFLHTNASKQKNRLIIETHSDYMINRFRYVTANSKSKISSQVLYFERDDKGTHVKHIPINSKGQFEGDAIEDYLKFFYDEEMKMLEI